MGPSVEDLLRDQDWVRALARTLVAGDDAEDLAQEAWLAVLRADPPTSGRSRAWLGGIVRNLARMLHRSEGRRRKRETGDHRPERPSLPPPDELSERLEQLRLVAGAVAELAEPYREAILLRYFEDRTPTEIAAHLGVPVATVKTRLRRALETLRAHLDARHDGRRAWQLAFLPWAFPESRVAPPPASTPGASGALTAGLAGGVMGAKSKVAAVVLGLGLLALLVTTGGPGAGDPSSSSTPDAARGRVTEGFREDAGERSEDSGVVLVEGESRALLRGLVEHHYTGAAIAGATVVAQHHDRVLERVESAADGEFRIELPRSIDSVRLGVIAEGYVPASRRLSVTEQHVSAGTVPLRPGVSVRGLVVTEKGVPVTGGEVIADALLGSGSFRPTGRGWTVGFLVSHDEDAVPRAPIDSNGRFELALLGDWTGICARVPGYAPALSRPFRLTELGDGEIRIVVGPEHVLRGRVIDGDRRALSGASVRVRPTLVGETRYNRLPCILRASTDESGHFSIRGMTSLYEELQVSLPGHGHFRGAGSTEEPVEVVLTPRGTRRIVGRVVTEPGVGLPHRRVRGWSGERLAFSAQLDEGSGFDAVLAGSASELQVLVPDFLPVVVSIPPDGEVVELGDVKVQPAAHVLSIRVQTESGEPMQGLTVAAREIDRTDGFRGSGRVTDADGRVTLRVPDEAVLELDIRSGPTDRVTVPATREEEQVIEYPGQTVLRGRVTDDGGEPVVGARLVVERTDATYSLGFEVDARTRRPDALSDTGGCFRFEVPRAKLGRTLAATGAGMGPVFVTLEGLDLNELAVTLEGGSVISGRVLNPAGQPVSDAAVKVSERVGNANVTIAATRAGEDGAFAFRCTSLNELTISAEAQGYMRSNAPRYRLTRGEVIDDVELRLRFGLVYDGRLLRADGSPWARAFLTVESIQDGAGTHRSSSIAYTDGDGCVTLNVHAGAVRLEVAEYLPRLAFEAPSAADLPVEIQAPEPGEIVLDPGNADLASARVEVSVQESVGRTHHRRASLVDGVWTVDWVLPGIHECTVRVNGRPVGDSVTVHVRSREATTLNLDLGSLAQYAVLVTDSAGAPVERARLELRAAGDDSRSWKGRTDATGLFEFSAANPVTGVLSIDHPRFAPATVREVIIGAADSPTEVQLKGGAVLEVRVPGQELSGLSIFLRGGSAQRRLASRYGATTNQAGRPFVESTMLFERVPAGAITVELKSPQQTKHRRVDVPESGTVTVEFDSCTIAWTAELRNQGALVERGTLIIRNRSGRYEAEIVHGGAEGVLEAEGDYQLDYAMGPDPQLWMELGTRTITAGSHHHVEVPGHPLDLLVELPDGSPAPGLRCSLARLGPHAPGQRVSSWLQSDGAGRARLPFLRGGRYSLQIRGIPVGTFAPRRDLDIVDGRSIQYRLSVGNTLRVRLVGDHRPEYPKFLHVPGDGSPGTLVSDRRVREPVRLPWPVGRSRGALVSRNAAIQLFEAEVGPEGGDVELHAQPGQQVWVKLDGEFVNDMPYRIEPENPEHLHLALRDRVTDEFGREGLRGVTLVPGRYRISMTLPDGVRVEETVDVVLGELSIVDFSTRQGGDR